MNREEILRLALEKAANADEAIKLAHVMLDFLEGPKAAAPIEAPVVKRSLTGRRHWKPAEIDFLVTHIGAGFSIADMAKHLNRSDKSVETAVNRLKRGERVGRGK